MLIPATAVDYLWQFQRLLPRGRIWHRGWGTAQAEQLLTLMPTWARLHQSANDLVGDIFPCSTVNLLPEWEASLGLPDPCVGPLPTLQQRQQAVCAKFVARGGQSLEYFQSVALSLGFPVQIEQFAPFRVDIDRIGDPLYGEEWAHVWQINAPNVTATYFRVDLSTIGEPLVAWGNELLECTIRAIAPAHTIVMFAYLDQSVWDAGSSIWDDGDSVWDLGYVSSASDAVEESRHVRD